MDDILVFFTVLLGRFQANRCVQHWPSSLHLLVNRSICSSQCIRKGGFQIGRSPSCLRRCLNRWAYNIRVCSFDFFIFQSSVIRMVVGLFWTMWHTWSHLIRKWKEPGKNNIEQVARRTKPFSGCGFIGTRSKQVILKWYETIVNHQV